MRQRKINVSKKQDTEKNEPEIKEPEINEPEINEPEINQPEINESEINEPENDTLKERYARFSAQTAEYVPEVENTETGTTIENEKINESSFENKFTKDLKAKMFLGFFCYVVSGLNTFILNKIKHTSVPLENMTFSETEKESLESYVQDSKVVELLDKLPVWLIAVLHVEFIMLQKHALYAEDYKTIKKVKKNKNDKS